MTEKKETKKTVETTTIKRDLSVEGVITCTRIQKPLQVFNYKGFQDVPNLIKFLGGQPRLTAEGKLQVRKFIIEDNTYIFTDEHGNVTNVLNQESFLNNYKPLLKKD